VSITWETKGKDDKLKLKLYNNTTTDWTLQSLVLVWPADGKKRKIKEIKMSGVKVWEGEAKNSPLTVSNWKKNTTAARTVNAGSPTTMEIKLDGFKTNAGSFFLTLSFSYDTQSCAVASGWP
ncbi:hypothetical protein D6833_09390, partial [Candidatus Parcubacteria bacterium]